MGQALRRATGIVRASAPTPAKPQNLAKAAVKEHARVGPDQVENVPKADNLPRMSINSNILEERDPQYDSMLNKMVGKISTIPGGKLEMGEAFIVESYKRPMPKLRSSKADASGSKHKPSPGTVDVAQLKQILLLHQGKSEDYQGSLPVDDIAKKFQIDVVQLQKILQFVSLPPEGKKKMSDQ